MYNIYYIYIFYPNSSLTLSPIFTFCLQVERQQTFDCRQHFTQISHSYEVPTLRAQLLDQWSEHGDAAKGNGFPWELEVKRTTLFWKMYLVGWLSHWPLTILIYRFCLIVYPGFGGVWCLAQQIYSEQRASVWCLDVWWHCLGTRIASLFSLEHAIYHGNHLYTTRLVQLFIMLLSHKAIPSSSLFKVSWPR